MSRIVTNPYEKSKNFQHGIVDFPPHEYYLGQLAKSPRREGQHGRRGKSKGR
jgi:hypothetical protein